MFTADERAGSAATPAPATPRQTEASLNFRRGRERVESIDGLRGIAALAVAWFHLYTQNGAALATAAVPHAFSVLSVWGRFGVQLFFAISGFVIAYTLLPDRRMNTPADIARYFVRRSVRLDPAYWCALVAYTVAMPVLIGISADLESASLERTGSGGEIAKQIVYFLPIDYHFYVPVAWTLVIEVQFYVLFALFVVSLNRLDGLWLDRDAVFAVAGALLIAASLMSITGISRPSGHWLYHHLHTFLGGIFLAAMKLRWRHAVWLFWVNTASMALGYGLQRETHVLASLLSALLLLMALYWSPLRRVLSTPSLLGLGALSYCVYLFHQLIGGLTVELLQRQASDTVGIHQIGFVVLGLLATVAFSAVVYFTVEKRSIEYAKRL